MLTLAGALILGSCSTDKETGGMLFPADGATGVNPDTHLVLTFHDTPAVDDSGMIRVFNARTGEPVDSLDLSPCRADGTAHLRTGV